MLLHMVSSDEQKAADRLRNRIRRVAYDDSRWDEYEKAVAHYQKFKTLWRGYMDGDNEHIVIKKMIVTEDHIDGETFSWTTDVSFTVYKDGSVGFSSFSGNSVLPPDMFRELIVVVEEARAILLATVFVYPKWFITIT